MGLMGMDELQNEISQLRSKNDQLRLLAERASAHAVLMGIEN
jgi:hypothetical protein